MDRLFTVAKLDEESKLYHINKNNIKYLEEYCEEGQFYDSPGLYIRFIIEEYCALPFIERERIYRKSIYDREEFIKKYSEALEQYK